MGQNFVLTGMIAFILKNFGSIDWLGPKDMISELEQQLPKKNSGPLQIVHCALADSIIREKKALIFFFSGRIDFFQKIVFNPLGLTEMIFQFAQWLPEGLAKPNK